MKSLKNRSTRLIVASLLVILPAFSAINTVADELAIPIGHQGADKTSLDRPKVGMKSDAVEAKFGAPLKRTDAVGKPPISSWEYPHYNVYFESDRVLHTVLKPYTEEVAAPVDAAPAAEPAPVAAPAPAAEPAPVVEAAPQAETVAPAPAAEGNQ